MLVFRKLLPLGWAHTLLRVVPVYAGRPLCTESLAESAINSASRSVDERHRNKPYEEPPFRTVLSGEGLAVSQPSEKEMTLAKVLLDIKSEHFPCFRRLIEKHGFSKTVDKLHDAKKELQKTQMDLNYLIKRCENRRSDAFVLANYFLAAVDSEGSEQAVSMLQDDVTGLVRLAVRASIVRKLRTLMKKDVTVHPAFVEACLRQRAKFERKLGRLASLLPSWCLQTLLNQKDTTWFNLAVSDIRKRVDALSLGLRSVMSQDIATQTACVCITKLPRILTATPAELTERTVQLVVVCGDAAANLIERNPSVLLRSFTPNVEERFKDLQAWTQTLYPKEPLLATMTETLDLLISHKYERTIHRLEYIALRGTINHQLLQISEMSNKNFERRNPGFDRWERNMYLDNEDEAFGQVLEQQWAEDIAGASVLRHIQDLPMFKTTLQNHPPLYSAQHMPILRAFFTDAVLKSIKKKDTVQCLMHVTLAQLRDTYRIIKQKTTLSKEELRQLISQVPKLIATDEKQREQLVHNLELYMEKYRNSKPPLYKAAKFFVASPPKTRLLG